MGCAPLQGDGAAGRARRDRRDAGPRHERCATACALPASRSSSLPAAAASATSRAPASRRASRRARRPPATRNRRRHQRHRGRDATRAPVVIVGAGLAGCALAGALAEGGRSSLLARASRRGRRRRLGQRRRPLPRRRPSRRRPARALSSRRRARRARAPCARRSRDTASRGSIGGLLRVELGAAIDGGAAGDRRRARPAARLRRGARRGRRQRARRRRACRAGLALPARRLGRSARPRARLRSPTPAGSVELRLGCAVAALRRDRRPLGAARRRRRDARRGRRPSCSCNAGGAFDLLGGRALAGRAAARPDQRRRRRRLPRRPRRRGCRSPAPAMSCLRSTARVWFGATRNGTTTTRRCAPATTSTNLERLARLVGGRRRRPSIGSRVEVGVSLGQRRSAADHRRRARGARRPLPARGRRRIIGAPRPAALRAARAGPVRVRALGSRGIASAALGARVLAR